MGAMGVMGDQEFCDNGGMWIMAGMGFWHNTSDERCGCGDGG